MPPEVTPGMQVRMMADLRAGKLALSCGPKCRDAWNGQLATISSLDQVERWSDSTLRIMQIGYGGDLAYFYLGRAAQGMGYHQAAIVYFMQSRALADSSDAAMQCAAAERPANGCRDVRIATSVPALIAASRAALQRDVAEDAASPTPARSHHGRTKGGSLLVGKAPSVDSVKHPASQHVAGLAQAIDTATLQVQGRTIPLAGVIGRTDAYAAQLQALIDAQGTTVHCARFGSGYTCMLPSGLNVARAALARGIATVAADAPPDFRVEEQAARAAHRGLWKSAGASG